MKQILAMTRKELLLWAQKPGSWVIVFVVPFLFIWIMGAVFGGGGTPVVTVYAVNEEDSKEARQVMRALREASSLKLEELETREEADRRVGAGERMAAIIVPEGFGSAMEANQGAAIEIIVDPARSEQSAVVAGLVQAAIGPIIVEAEVSRGVEAGVARILDGIEQNGQEAQTGDDLNPTDETTGQVDGQDISQEPGVEPTPVVDTSVDGAPAGETPEGESPEGEAAGGLPENEESELAKLRRFFASALKGIVSSQVQESLENPQVQLVVQPFEGQEKIHRPSLLDYLVPGYSLMFVFFLIPNLALTVIEEREVGTLRRLLVAPVPRSRILLGKMLPYFLIAVVQLLTVLLVSKFVFGVDLGSSPLALFIVIVCSALVMAGLGIFIAAVAQTEGQADGLALVVILSMAVVSGAMFPSISIPGLQLLTPHYWSMQGFLNVIARGMGVESVLLPAGILLTMATVFFTIGAIRFRFE